MKFLEKLIQYKYVISIVSCVILECLIGLPIWLYHGELNALFYGEPYTSKIVFEDKIERVIELWTIIGMFLGAFVVGVALFLNYCLKKEFQKEG